MTRAHMGFHVDAATLTDAEKQIRDLASAYFGTRKWFIHGSYATPKIQAWSGETLGWEVEVDVREGEWSVLGSRAGEG